MFNDKTINLIYKMANLAYKTYALLFDKIEEGVILVKGKISNKKILKTISSATKSTKG